MGPSGLLWTLWASSGPFGSLWYSILFYLNILLRLVVVVVLVILLLLLLLLLGDGGDLLGDGFDLLGDGVDLLGDGGDPRSIAGGSSKTTVAQKGDQRLEIRKCDQRTNQPTNGLTWVGARDTCVSKNYKNNLLLTFATCNDDLQCDH